MILQNGSKCFIPLSISDLSISDETAVAVYNIQIPCNEAKATIPAAQGSAKYNAAIPSKTSSMKALFLNGPVKEKRSRQELDNMSYECLLEEKDNMKRQKELFDTQIQLYQVMTEYYIAKKAKLDSSNDIPVHHF
jgi:hypothetical protein